MRQGQQNNRNNRQRGRGRRQNTNSGGNQSNRVYDSNGPEVRVRGSAQTVADKYLQLAGDAQSQGDQIKTESYFQYAEHYLRIVATNKAAKDQKQAEKDKAAEEHAARMQEKQEKAAAELEKKAPTAAKPENPPQEKPRDENGKDADDEEWGGHQPAFLQRDDNASSQKPKKPRRKPAKNKSADSSDSEDSNVEIAAAPESEQEATSAS